MWGMKGFNHYRALETYRRLVGKGHWTSKLSSTDLIPAPTPQNLKHRLLHWHEIFTLFFLVSCSLEKLIGKHILNDNVRPLEARTQPLSTLHFNQIPGTNQVKYSCYSGPGGRSSKAFIYLALKPVTRNDCPKKAYCSCYLGLGGCTNLA